jgi:hypothetical protein
MPTETIANPLFANNPPGSLLTPQMDGWWGADPAIALATWAALVPTAGNTPSTVAAAPTAPGVGAVVQIQGWNGTASAASGGPLHPTFALSSTTADGSIIGVVQGMTTGGQGVTVLGAACKVRSFGIGLVLVDNTTVVGHALVQSTGTAGVAHDSGGVGGTQNETIGIALAALTISSGLGIIPAFIKLT